MHLIKIALEEKSIIIYYLIYIRFRRTDLDMIKKKKTREKLNKLYKDFPLVKHT